MMKALAWVFVGAVVVGMGACGRSSGGEEGGKGKGVEVKVPAEGPEKLPKVKGEEVAIVGMLRERFGEGLVRTLRIGVEEAGGGGGGKRLVVTGEVPSEEVRQAVMKELDVRVEGVQVSDVRLEVAGAIRMITAFDVRMMAYDEAVFSPDLAVFINKAGEVYEVATGRRINRMRLEREMNCMAVSPDGRLLVTGHDLGEVKVWEMPLATKPRVLVAARDVRANNKIVAITFTADSRGVVTVDRERGEVMLWEVATGKGRAIGAHMAADAGRGGPDGYTVAVSPDGKTIAVGTNNDPGVTLWDVEKRAKKGVLDLERVVAKALAWSHDGKTIAAGRTTGEKRGVALFDVASGKGRVLALEQDALVAAVAFSPDDRMLAVRYESEGTGLWEVEKGTKWQTIDREKEGGGKGVAFSPDGNVLATGCATIRPSGVRLWDVSARPGGKGGVAGVPAALTGVERHDDKVEMEIARSIRGSRPERDVEALEVKVFADGSVRLRGKVADEDFRRRAGEIAEGMRANEEYGAFGKRKVINELEVSGRGAR